MKILWSTIAIFLLVCLHANAQTTLNDDPVFKATIKHHIHYPVTGIRASVYGRFYVKFTIDSAGGIQNPTVVYPKITPKYAKRLGFEYELIHGLKLVPHLSPQYKGSYILPFAFVYINYSEDSAPRVPTNTLPETYLDNSVLLNEISVIGRSDTYKTVRTFSNIAPPSRQIILF